MLASQNATIGVLRRFRHLLTPALDTATRLLPASAFRPCSPLTETRGQRVMGISVLVSVFLCLFASISPKPTRPVFINLFVRVTCCRGSVLPPLAESQYVVICRHLANGTRTQFCG